MNRYIIETQDGKKHTLESNIPPDWQYDTALRETILVDASYPCNGKWRHVASWIMAKEKYEVVK